MTLFGPDVKTFTFMEDSKKDKLEMNYCWRRSRLEMF